MLEVVLMSVFASSLHARHTVKLRKHILQETRHAHKRETDRWYRRLHYLVELDDDTLLGDDVYALGLTADTVEGVVVDVEAKLRGDIRRGG